VPWPSLIVVLRVEAPAVGSVYEEPPPLVCSDVEGAVETPDEDALGGVGASDVDEGVTDEGAAPGASDVPEPDAGLAPGDPVAGVEDGEWLVCGWVVPAATIEEPDPPVAEPPGVDAAPRAAAARLNAVPPLEDTADAPALFGPPGYDVPRLTSPCESEVPA
jgi:hypothetical protein